MYVCMPRLSSLLQKSMAFLRARLVHVCVTEYYLEPLHARKVAPSVVARAVELELIAARSLLKAASDIAPSCFATDSGPFEGKLGIGVSWRWVIVVRMGRVAWGISGHLRYSKFPLC